MRRAFAMVSSQAAHFCQLPGRANTLGVLSRGRRPARSFVRMRTRMAFGSIAASRLATCPSPKPDPTQWTTTADALATGQGTFLVTFRCRNDDREQPGMRDGAPG